MESLFFLIPLGLIFIVIAVKILFWAINSGQYDNLDSEGHRILFDDPEPNKTEAQKTIQESAPKKESQAAQSPTNSSSEENK